MFIETRKGTQMLVRIETMTCSGCARKIGQAIATVDGSARVEADVSQRLLRIESTAEPRDVLQAIESAGYRAIVVPEGVHAPRAGCCGCGGASQAKAVDTRQTPRATQASCCGPSL